MHSKRNLRCAALATLFGLGLGASFGVAAEAGPVEWSATAGGRYRTLSEWASPSGAKLLTEKGEMVRVQLSAQTRAPEWPVLLLETALAGGRLAYQGQTQAGVPLATTSHHTDFEASLQWRPLPPAAWGEAWLVLGWLQTRRDIAASLSAGGLKETSSMVMPGVRWRSPAIDLPFAGGTKLSLDTQLRASAWHRLDVNYFGVFDKSVLRGGPRTQAVLGLHASTAGAWQASLEWSHSRQTASRSAPLYRAGALVGSVRQPRLGVDDLTFSLTRRF